MQTYIRRECMTNRIVSVVHQPCGSELGRYAILSRVYVPGKETLRTMLWGCSKCQPGPLPGTSLTVPTDSICVLDVV